MQENYCMNLGCSALVEYFQAEPFCSECESFTLDGPPPYNDVICATIMGDNAVKIVWRHHDHWAITSCLIEELEAADFRHVLMPSRPPDELWQQVCMWVASRKSMIIPRAYAGVFQTTKVQKYGNCARCGGTATRCNGVRDYCARCLEITGSFRPEQETCRGCHNLARKGRDMCRVCNSKQIAELQARNVSAVHNCAN